jgi:hypothetical protein
LSALEIVELLVHRRVEAIRNHPVHDAKFFVERTSLFEGGAALQQTVVTSRSDDVVVHKEVLVKDHDERKRSRTIN